MDNNYGLAELHNQLLIIIDDIDRVCRTHGIEYTLFYGTLLGAVRHKGFIPWDDDADVVMVREEFEKFIAVYEQEKNPDFKVMHVCNPVSYSIVNPAYEVPGMRKGRNNIINPWVTVFAFDNAPADPDKFRKKATKVRFVTGMYGRPPQYENFPLKSKLLWSVTAFCGKIYGRRNVEKLYHRLCNEDNDKDTGVYGNYCLNNEVIYHCFPSKCFREYIDTPYEDRTYRRIKDADEILTIEYGDYMTPPPEDKRDPRHMRKQNE